MPVTSSVARTGMPRPPTAPSREGSTPPSAIPYTERAAATRSSRTVFAVAASAITRDREVRLRPEDSPGHQRQGRCRCTEILPADGGRHRQGHEQVDQRGAGHREEQRPREVPLGPMHLLGEVPDLVEPQVREEDQRGGAGQPRDAVGRLQVAHAPPVG